MAGNRQGPDRSRQKLRTHRAIVEAAAAIVREGRQPTIAEAAENAGVHRSTAYRYFPTPESLLADATLTAFAPSTESVFDGVSPDDPVALIEAAVRAVAAYSFREEAMFRSIVRVTIDRWFTAQASDDPDSLGPIRETRRFRYVDHALRPLADRLEPDELRRLGHALTLVFGAEAVIVTRDVCNLEPAEAIETMVWAATSLVRSALEQADAGRQRPPAPSTVARRTTPREGKQRSA